MYPEDVAALFAAVPVGTKVWLINDPVKVAYVDGDLLLEVHPPVDGEGQTVEPNLELLSKQLDRALGNNTAPFIGISRVKLCRLLAVCPP